MDGILALGEKWIRGVKEKLDLGFLAEGREDRIILGFILNLEKDIEGFNGWNFEWKMETRSGKV